MSDNASLNNSMVAPEQHPLVIQHTKVLQALKSVEGIIKRANTFASNYAINSDTTTTARETLYLIFQLNQSALQILEEVLEE